MTKLLGIVAVAALLTTAASVGAVAKPGGGGGPSFAGGGNKGGTLRGLNRADFVAGSHGAQGRAIARTRGVHSKGFCPPGLAKQGRC
jgi:hypothetical protein